MDLSPDNLPASPARFQAAAAADSQRNRLDFHGSGAEYFRIWIVNVVLTVLTLGVYSAWAKVRKNRYIYGNVELAGSRLEYLAQPLQILRGRLLAIALLIVVLVSQSVFPPLYMLSLLIIVLATPWLIVRARRFNMRYTAYRNIRFAFAPAYGEAYKTILWWGFLTFLTFGLVAPYAHFRRNRLIVSNTAFGNLSFKLGDVAGRFYSAYFLGFCLGALVVTPALGLLGIAGGQLQGSAGGTSPTSAVMLAPVLLTLVLYYVVAKFVMALTLRTTTNHTIIESEDSSSAVSCRLGCDWSLPGMLWIYLTNLIALIVSLGLLTPWAQIRILQYQLRHTWVDIAGNLDEIVAAQGQQVSSIGEEIGDVFDVDIGL